MAKHEILIHENTGATKESAPYLGSYVSKDTVKTDTFIATLAEMCGLPAIQAQAILTGCFDAIEKLEKEAPVRMHLDGFYVAAAIFGSFPTSDAAFDPEVNSLQLAMRLDDDVKLELVDVTPTIVTDVTVTKVRVDHVMDEAVPRPYELIHGRHVFQVTGLNLVITDVGATVFLTNNLGVTFPCTVVQAVSKQVLRVRSTNLLEAGDYKLVVKSRGGDAEGPLQVAYRNVKYLKIDDLPRFTGTDPTGEIPVTASGTFGLVGANLGEFLDAAKLATSGLKFVANTLKVGETPYTRNLASADEIDLAASTASRLVVKTAGFHGDLSTLSPSEAVAGKILATVNEETISADCTLKVSLPKIEISNYTATNSVEGTNVKLNVANPEAVVGYAKEGDVETMTANFYSYGRSEPDVKTITLGTDGKWGVLLFDGSSVEAGISLRIVLEHNPAKTQYDPTDAEAAVIVTE